MKRRKNSKIRYVFILLVLVMGIGFAYIYTHLNINTIFSFREGNFSMYLYNEDIEETYIDDASIDLVDNNTLTLSGTFNKPGDFIDYSFYIVNDGTVTGVIDSLSNDLNSDYIKYTFKYSDGSEFNEGDIFYAGSVKRIDARVEYDYNVDSFATGNLSVTFNMGFVQASREVLDNIKVWDYPYIPEEQYFYVLKSGNYRLETWGAQGGNLDATGSQHYLDSLDYPEGGYGGYSTGDIYLEKGTKLYLYTGGAGMTTCLADGDAIGGFNGGGSVLASDYTFLEDQFVSSGGGATHISLLSGYLSDIEGDVNSIVMVSGGGSGASYYSYNYRTLSTGSGGGKNGGKTKYYDLDDGTLTLSGGGYTLGDSCSFGLGTGGGGGGYCGGDGSGGSGYIGYEDLFNKAMYCVGCGTSNSTGTKTFETTNVSEEPISQYAKIGNGHIRITALN